MTAKGMAGETVDKSGSGNNWAGPARRFAALAVLGVATVGFLAGTGHAAIFDDGNDRKLLFDLREKPLLTRSDDEHLILRAADRYGNVGFCSSAGGNAVLIDYFGRPAIITPAHRFFDADGKQRCTDEELHGATYMPNVSYFDERGKHPRSFTHRQVKLVTPAVNWNTPRRYGRYSSRIKPEDDFIIFYLEEDIVGDPMPDGHERGALALAAIGPLRPSPQKQPLWMIGIAPDIKKGLAVLYQSCRLHAGRTYGAVHDCDTVAGSSGSALLVLESDELRLVSVHTGSIYGNATRPASDDPYDWNFTTYLGDINSASMKALYVEPFRDPQFIPYHLQFLLRHADCYSGKLDNKWGPGSRAALDRFVAATGASLPGREPSMELWDALEEAVKEHGEACR